MTWGKLLQPDLVLGTTIISLTPDLIKHNNLKGLILDVDETLVPFYAADTSPELNQWVETIKPHFQLWLVSNNISQSRISNIANALNLPFIAGAGKPSRRKLRQAVTSMELLPSQIGMVGDRLFTDILAGNRLGMFTILVEPMVSPGEDLFIKHHIRSAEVWVSQILGVTLK